MKENPILFRTEMVKAILDGRKTQTRRIVKEPFQSYSCVTKHITSCEFDFHYDQGVGQFTKCPYGKSGDILWVRETWVPKNYDKSEYIYKATDEHGLLKWKPSIHMPKEACRIKLLIKDIRVERLLDISDSEAKAEGVESSHEYKSEEPYLHQYRDYYNGGFDCDARSSFITLWWEIHGPDSHLENPWLWVIEFENINNSKK